MRKLIFMCFIIISLSCFAYSPQSLKFHCAKDTLKIKELLSSGLNSGLNTPNQLVLFYGEKLIDTPYVAHTLEGNEEKLTINIDQLDCTTFVETLIALTKTTLLHRSSWRDYAQELESIRYRKGEIKGYASRLHYISDWTVENVARGNIKEVTSNFPLSTTIIKSIDYMSSNRDKYPALKSDDVFEQIKNIEIGYRMHKYPVLKKSTLLYKNVKGSFIDGDIVALVTKIDGLDVSHMGIIKMVNGTPYLLDASSVANKVKLEDDTLNEMLRRSKSNIGIRIYRIVE